MTTVGPTLPTHLLKRKRSSSPDTPSTAVDTSKPPHHQSRSSPSDENTSKTRRIIGPSLPPAPLSERPSSPPTAQETPPSPSDSSDDDFGPSLPSTKLRNSTHQRPSSSSSQAPSKTTPSPPAPEKPQREDWMLAPPSSTDWTSRIDPTKLRNRRFQSGKSASKTASSSHHSNGGGSPDIGSTWTETPEQRRKRLEDEAMGVRAPFNLDSSVSGPDAEATTALARKRQEIEDREREDTERQVREYNEKYRGGSLYERHEKRERGEDKEKEDDPSARAFDREKDIAGGMKLGHRARKDMVERAKGMGDRFSKGSYL